MNDYSSFSKKFRSIKVYLTGYGAFEGVVNNPSELLVKNILDNKEKIHSTLGNGMEIYHAEILKVAIKEVNEKTKMIFDKIDSLLRENRDEMHLLIHFGVNDGAEKINLETQCVNMFSGDDVEGCTINGKINEECSNDFFKCKIEIF